MTVWPIYIVDTLFIYTLYTHIVYTQVFITPTATTSKFFSCWTSGAIECFALRERDPWEKLHFLPRRVYWGGAIWRKKKHSPTLNNSVQKVTMCNINVSVLAAIVQRVLKQVRGMSDSFVSRSLLEQINLGVEGTPVRLIYIYIYIYTHTYENHKLYSRQIYTVFKNAPSHWVDVKWDRYGLDPISSQPSFPFRLLACYQAQVLNDEASQSLSESEKLRATKMSLQAFRDFLVEHKVELSKFGTGRVRFFCFEVRKKSCQPKKNPSNGFCLVNCCWCRGKNLPELEVALRPWSSSMMMWWWQKRVVYNS